MGSLTGCILIQMHLWVKMSKTWCITPKVCSTRCIMFFGPYHVFIPQTGLALMEFSRYCLSSLDLTNFVVRSCRGAVAELSQSRAALPRLDLADSLESGNMGIWKIQESGNLASQKSKNESSKNLDPCCPKCWQGPDE